MAQRTVVHWVDDLDGGEAEGTVTFGLDGISYELDLSQQNAAALRETLAGYIAHARREPRAAGTRPRRAAAGSSRRGSRSSAPDHNAAVRVWARRHGYTVADRGRIRKEITEAYQRHANGTGATVAQNDAWETGTTTPVDTAIAETVDDEAASTSPAEPFAVGLDGLTVTEREKIRAWAQREGIEVKARGRLSRDLIANYRDTMARLGAKLLRFGKVEGP